VREVNKLKDGKYKRRGVKRNFPTTIWHHYDSRDLVRDYGEKNTRTWRKGRYVFDLVVCFEAGCRAESGCVGQETKRRESAPDGEFI
jgi:hypothetical protein